MLKRIISPWWGVPLLSIGILAVHTLSLLGIGWPRVSLSGVLAGVALVPLWLVVVLVCRKRWQVARVWRHWLAGGVVELLQLVWCVFAFLLYAAVVVAPGPDAPPFAPAADLPGPQPAGAATVGAPGVCVEQGDARGVYGVVLRLPSNAGTEGVFVIRTVEHASGAPVETAPMVHRVTEGERAAAGNGVLEIRFPAVSVYERRGGGRFGSRWQVFFLPDDGEEEFVAETPYLIEGCAP